MSQLLRAEGYTVDSADNAKAGLALYKAGRHDLVITDILMPHMNGLALIECLSHEAPRPRVIAVSGDSSLSMPVFLPAAKGLGAERMLAKPIQAGVLLRTVADVLAQPRQETETAQLQ
jgi:DNA-binding NtrC family response regulator